MVFTLVTGHVINLENEEFVVFLPGFQTGRAQFRPKKAICVVALRRSTEKR
jgi:hypothetical protein